MFRPKYMNTMFSLHAFYEREHYVELFKNFDGYKTIRSSTNNHN
jgi:hypothetical protein